MRVSVIVRTRDEAPRLRLVLASLARQSVPAEVVVVNDGSADGTATLLAEVTDPPYCALHHPQSLGRSAASNAGARVARGDVLLFLDGDVLAAPDLVARHLALHADGPPLVVRGDTWHLRCTRFFRDPERGVPGPGFEGHVGAMGAELGRSLVTREQVLQRFEEIHNRAQPGIYSGAGPRRLYELEMDALLHHPSLSVLWMAASGHNLSVSREHFLAAGGFDERIDINEQRDLALRLCRRGLRLVAAPGAHSYHLTHRVGWRDPLVEREWAVLFEEKHPGPAVRLLKQLWRTLAGDRTLSPEDRIESLPQLEEVLRRESGGGA